ncbi:hypothetical protein CEY16_02245 [Halalkalibacillus sediminis]|uniref:YlqD protein n=1 Tax=Halalkalibacillus sediminis TaxID=2018042 RepID=A0A2I0QW79_9BACI|nr:YlqD family protein [Halalkalibacillus sediminis]PKR78597.1 hypothetical protein CEY16_02245 [Halalkalibacillus sediminis]
MKILRKTKIKQVITENSKSHIISKFNKRIDRLTNEIDQLQFEKKKMIYQKRSDAQRIEQRFAEEEKKRQQRIDWARKQIEQIETLPLGSEVVEGEVEEVIELEVGDRWDDAMGERSILIKDGEIIKIDR